MINFKDVACNNGREDIMYIYNIQSISYAKNLVPLVYLTNDAFSLFIEPMDDLSKNIAIAQGERND